MVTELKYRFGRRLNLLRLPQILPSRLGAGLAKGGAVREQRWRIVGDRVVTLSLLQSRLASDQYPVIVYNDNGSRLRPPLGGVWGGNFGFHKFLSWFSGHLAESFD